MEKPLIRFRDKRLQLIWEKVSTAERLTFDDGHTLFQTNDFYALGKMARYVQMVKNGDAVYFSLNQKIEPTNICVLTCKFCNFGVTKYHPRAYELTIDAILKMLNEQVREVHITGALHPEWSFEHYVHIIRAIREHFPRIGIKAFTAVEIWYFHKKFNLSIEEVLKRLQEAGVQALPGGGAEVFSERIHNELFPQKLGAKEWLSIHRTAHLQGLPSNATILYGHIETIEERVNHLLQIRSLQDETGGFLSFIPLAFQPGTTKIKPYAYPTSALDDLKMIAVSRLLLDNVPHIKAYWVMSTEEVASAALNYGADDLEGTVGGERIAHDAGARTPTKLSINRILSLIRDAGKIPVERDIMYNPIAIHSPNVIGKIPYLNSVPFFTKFTSSSFKLLPLIPKQMGILAEKKQLLAGLFPLIEYLRLKSMLLPLPYCLSSRDQVKSVLLFSNEGWKQLEGKKIGVTDATVTSVMLLKVLLRVKYNVNAHIERLPPMMSSYTHYDAVLLIGDQALKHKKDALGYFELIFDLAHEWYEWKRLPFVFALWAIQASATEEEKSALLNTLNESIDYGERNFAKLCGYHAKQLKISEIECIEYLEGFNFRMGQRELASIQEFERCISELITIEH
ncbi:MAG: aminofutalosine synthase MqnE [Bacteroidetes bacterium]|nr:aminofutalosine synthase MqnE [Bacteroidota bacterium]